MKSAPCVFVLNSAKPWAVKSVDHNVRRYLFLPSFLLLIRSDNFHKMTDEIPRNHGTFIIVTS